MESLRTLIVDDERLARKGVRTLLKPHPDIDVIGECGNGVDAVDQIIAQKPDLVFLDIQMPGLDGFGVIEEVGMERMPVVVFVTAYDLHAMKAFQVHAIDYLLKPIDPEKFRHALERSRALLAAKARDEMTHRLTDLLHSLHKTQGHAQRFIVRSIGKTAIVQARDVEWIEAEGDYVRLHLSGKSHLMRGTMGTIASRLAPSEFVRVHRSTIVRISLIKEISPTTTGDQSLRLHNGLTLTLSRTYRDAVLRALDGVGT